MKVEIPTKASIEREVVKQMLKIRKELLRYRQKDHNRILKLERLHMDRRAR